MYFVVLILSGITLTAAAQTVDAEDALAVQHHAKQLHDAQPTLVFEQWQRTQWSFAAAQCLHLANVPTPPWLKSTPQGSGSHRLMQASACKQLARQGPDPMCWSWQSYQAPFVPPYPGFQANYLFIAKHSAPPASGSVVNVGAKCLLSKGAKDTEQFFAGKATLVQLGPQVTSNMHTPKGALLIKQMSVRLQIDGYAGAQPVLNLLQPY